MFLSCYKNRLYIIYYSRWKILWKKSFKYNLLLLIVIGAVVVISVGVVNSGSFKSTSDSKLSGLEDNNLSLGLDKNEY